MRRTWLGLALMAAGLGGGLHSPMPWSPDGSWIAYTAEVRPLDRLIAPGWTFDAARPDRRPQNVEPVAYRLWASQAATGASVLLEESTAPLTAPGWAPDGRGLAFGRVVAEAGSPARFEVVILEGLKRRRVVSSRPMPAGDQDPRPLLHLAVAWSPDGRYLAAPQPDPAGLAILRVDTGQVVNSIEGGFLPSWSPAEGRLAFFVASGGTTPVLQVIDSALGQPRHLMHDVRPDQAPAWARDGASLVVARRAPEKRGPEPIELVRVRSDTAAVEPIRGLAVEGGPSGDRAAEGTSIALDAGGENLFTVAGADGRASHVLWYRPQEGGGLRRFAPVDPTAPAGSLALSPDGRTLAAQVGPPGRASAPALCEVDPDTPGPPRVRLVTPDDSTRLDWIATLVRSARLILADVPPPRGAPAGPPARVERPTILPLPHELTARRDVLGRLRRIGQLGRPLCDRPADAPGLDPATAEVIDEARLFFDYLRGDFAEAARSLDRYAAWAATPGRRLALLTVRAQILIQQGQFVQARRVVELLEEAEGRDRLRVEWTGAGYVVTPEPRPGRGWPARLAEATRAAQAELDDARRVVDDPFSERDDGTVRPREPSPPAFRLPAGDDPPPIRLPKADRFLGPDPAPFPR